MQNKKLTGYPHIDKPWMKYYTEEQKQLIIPEMNLSEYIKDRNKNNLSSVAEVYYGNEITYDELFYNNSLAAKVLSQIGVKKGDVIGMLLPNIPEAGQLFLGATELGAIADFIDPRPDSADIVANAKKLLEVLIYEKVKYIVALDIGYISILKPIENELKELGIDSIITVSIKDSMTINGKIEYLEDVVAYNKLKKSRDSSIQLEDYKAILNKIKNMEILCETYEVSAKTSPIRILKYSDLKIECENAKYNAENNVNAVNYIGHTSGTSGSRPKPIPITNKNGIAAIIQGENVGLTPKAGSSAFHLLPFFSPAGAYSSYINYLGSGVKVIDISEFEVQDFGYLVKKHKPTLLGATPAWFNGLHQYDLLKNETLSYLKHLVYVGDSMSLENAELLQKWLKEHGSSATVVSAHGMSESLGCGSFSHPKYNKVGSIGIPMPNTIYTLVDPDTEDELIPLKFEDGKERLVGELIVSSPCVTNGVLHNEVITKHYELDGESYIRTRDLVEMDKDGFFYHKDRKDRSFCRFDGYKVIPYKIEEAIESNKYVKYAKIVGYFDKNVGGLKTICHMVIEDEYSNSSVTDIVHDIVYNTIIANPNMSSRQIPSKFKIRKDLPLTKNNKVSFKALESEKLDGNEIEVIVEETNLSVGKIEIY